MYYNITENKILNIILMLQSILTKENLMTFAIILFKKYYCSAVLLKAEYWCRILLRNWNFSEAGTLNFNCNCPFVIVKKMSFYRKPNHNNIQKKKKI